MTDAAVQVVESALGVATVMPAGSVSVSTELKVVAVVLLFRSAMVSVEVPPEVIEVGAKLLVSEGAAAVTVSAAEAALAGPKLVLSTPAAILSVATPGVLEVTVTEIVQPPAGKTAPLA